MVLSHVFIFIYSIVYHIYYTRKQIPKNCIIFILIYLLFFPVSCSFQGATVSLMYMKNTFVCVEKLIFYFCCEHITNFALLTSRCLLLTMKIRCQNMEFSYFIYFSLFTFSFSLLFFHPLFSLFFDKVLTEVSSSVICVI